MIGTIRWNFIIGAISCCLTFLFSFMQNPWSITITHSVYSFLLLFIFGFLFRWILGTVVGLKHLAYETETSDEEGRGHSIDIVTPDDDQAMPPPMAGDPNKPSTEDSGFKPLKPTELFHKNKFTDEEMVEAVRHLSED